MNQQFLRMQQLAGVKVQPAFDELVIEALTEYYLYNNYYSKGILKEKSSKQSVKWNISQRNIYKILQKIYFQAYLL